MIIAKNLFKKLKQLKNYPHEVPHHFRCIGETCVRNDIVTSIGWLWNCGCGCEAVSVELWLWRCGCGFVALVKLSCGCGFGGAVAVDLLLWWSCVFRFVALVELWLW